MSAAEGKKNMGLFCYIAAIVWLAASAHADGFALDVHRIEGSRSRLMRTGKWTEDPTSAIRSTRLASNSQPLIDYDDGEYIANVTVGTPPQRFLVLLNLKTGEFWVPDKRCPSKKCPSFCSDAVYCKSLCDPRCCNAKRVAEFVSSDTDKKGDCGWRNRFDSSKSSSYVKNGTHFTDIFSRDINADGFVGVDTVMIGGTDGLQVLSQTFGQATSADFSSDDAFDGVLGLGSDTFGPGLVPLLENAKTQKVIPSHVVTVALIREGVQSPDLPGGTITYGGVDKKNCDPKVSYIQTSSSGDPSVLTVDGMSFGSFEAADVQWTASIELTATALRGPTDVMDGLANVVGAVKDQYHIYNIACNATVPSLHIWISGQDFVIPPSELVRPLGATADDCMLNVRGGFPGLFFIGAALARQYCLIFDYDNVQFGYSVNYYGLAKG